MSNNPQEQSQEISQVEEHQGTLQWQIDAYEKKLSHLEQWLERVLQPVECSGDEGTVEQDDELCPLAGWLRSQHREMGVINGRLDHILERLML